MTCHGTLGIGDGGEATGLASWMTRSEYQVPFGRLNAVDEYNVTLLTVLTLGEGRRTF